MSRTNDTTDFYKAGQIQTREGKKGVEVLAYNFQHGKPLHIGTLIGSVYEKTAPILHKPEPSFALPKSELGAVIEQGAAYIRFIGRGMPGTYSISVDDFQLHGIPYFNRSYGNQIRVSLRRFEYSPKVQKRNNIVDNPPVERTRDIIQERQMPLFGGRS